MKKKIFYDLVRASLFGGSLKQAQVNGMEGVFDAWETHGQGDKTLLIYALATAYWETGRAMMPNRENLNYTSAGRIIEVFGRGSRPRIKSLQEAAQYVRQPQLLANKVYNGMLGNLLGSNDGWTYRGGGYPHLTGRANYRKSSADAGVDLVEYPEAMLDPEISGRVLIRGLRDGRWNASGNGLRYYEMLDGQEGMTEAEFTEARRTINGKDKAREIARIALLFQEAVEQAQ